MWWAHKTSRTFPPKHLEPRSHLDSGRLFLLRNLVLFEFASFVAYDNAMKMAPRIGAPFWLPDSVLLCALLLTPPRTWWIYLTAPLPLRLLVSMPSDVPIWFLLAAFLNDSFILNP